MGLGHEGETAPLVRGRAALRIHRRLFVAPLDCFDEVATRYGRICTVATPLRPHRRRVIFALGADGNRHVLTDPEAFRTTGQGLSGPRGSALRRVRNGLTRTRGEKHRRIRALLLPSLARRAIAEAAPRVASIVAEQIEPWRSGATIDLGREMRALSLRISSEVLFGIGDRAQAAAIGELLGDFMRRSFATPVLATRIYGRLPGTPYDALHRHAERIEAAVERLIEQRRSALGDDVVSALVRANAEGVPWLTDDDLVGQVTLLFGASYETTAQALTWTLILLAQHPDAAKLLRDELVAAGGGAAPEFETLDALPFLDGVIRESLRMFPPVPYTIRIATRDASLLGAAVRRGDRVLCSHFFTHREAAVFPEPKRFAPERWRTVEPDPFEYLPFSVAPRMCIGAGFSSAVLKRAISAVALRHDFALPDRTRIDPVVRVTLGPRASVPLRLEDPVGSWRRAQLLGGFGELVAQA
jgi:cytochrome P450